MKQDLERVEVLNFNLQWSRLALKPVKSYFCGVAAPFHRLLSICQPMKYATAKGHLSLDLLVSEIKMVSVHCMSYRLVWILINLKIWFMHCLIIWIMKLCEEIISVGDLNTFLTCSFDTETLNRIVIAQMRLCQG